MPKEGWRERWLVRRRGRREEGGGGGGWTAGTPGILVLVDAGWKERAGSEAASAGFFFIYLFFLFNLIGVHPCRGAGERRAERQH